MTVKELLEKIENEKIPMDAQIAFWGNGDGSFYQITDDVEYDKVENQLNIGH